jgi:putative aldouronate transport system substrate-binding protein
VNGTGEAGGPYLRWDLYKELGLPKIENIEDYLPVLKAMLELEPTNPAGQKNYGITIFDDWDGNVSWPVRIITEMYGVTQDGLGFVERNHVAGTMASIYNDDSYFKRAIKFYYEANQQGLMDPDLITDGWDDYVEKVGAGRSMFQLLSWTSWTYETDETRNSLRSYKGVWFDSAKIILGAPTYTGGSAGNTWYAISSATKHLDEALAFIDYLYSYDGEWKLAWGEQGVAWDVNADGLPYRTVKGWEMKNGNLPFDNGGLIGEGLNVVNAFGLPWSVVNPTYGARMDELDWPRGEGAPDLYKVDEDWSEIMGARDGVDYLIQNDLYVTPPYVPALPAYTDDLQAIYDQLSSINKEYTYKLIVAKDDAEFDALWTELVSIAEEIGVEEINAWVIENYEANLAEGSKYMY